MHKAPQFFILSGLIFTLIILTALSAFAGPPYMTDDPDPVPYHHWEFYTFFASDKTAASNAYSGPAFEINNGVAPNTQVHLIIPEAYSAQDGISFMGMGDIELGVKFRFQPEKRAAPEIGVFPLMELSTGDAAKGLGNGRTWFKVPMWIQKSWGAWTSYGGFGYAFNSAPGQRDFPYGGILIQRNLSPQWTLGGEIFAQGATAQVPSSRNPPVAVAGENATVIWNVGGQYNFTPDFSFLFTAGHSFAGDGNAVMYFGLYRTWGPGAP
jgi:hypothetical protein